MVNRKGDFMSFFYLEKILEKNRLSQEQLAKSLDVTPQAISGWKNSDTIPAKRVIQISKLFSLSAQDVDVLLGNKPLNFFFRTKTGDELNSSNISSHIKVRTEIIYERFFGNITSSITYNLSKLRDKINKDHINHIEIAQFIRDEFEFPSYQPLSYSMLNTILDRIHVRSYYLPFKYIGLSDEGENGQAAVLFEKDKSYSILVDSDRTIDESHFDKTHELLHILFDDVDMGETDQEDLIDKVCGELIYPKKFIIEVFFDGDENSKPIKDKEKLSFNFFENSKNHAHILSPKGLALAMRDANLTSINSELYKFILNELHQAYRKKSVNYSSLGQMDFDFTNREEFLKFFEIIKNPDGIFTYPLFEKLKCDLLNGSLSPVDFADTFGMKISDALIIKASLSKRKHASSK
jgi:transcriptional regulator with XRE-family HTH domain